MSPAPFACLTGSTCTGIAVLPLALTLPRHACPQPQQCQNGVDAGGGGGGQAAQFGNRPYQRVNLQRAARQQVLQHRRAVRAHGGPAVDAAVDVDGKGDAQLSAMVCASTIIARATARVPGSVHSTSSVAWVRAEIGLNDRLPRSFTQISSRRRGLTGALRPAVDSALDKASARGLFSPEGSPTENRLPSTWVMVPGSLTSAAG